MVINTIDYIFFLKDEATMQDETLVQKIILSFQDRIGNPSTCQDETIKGKYNNGINQAWGDMSLKRCLILFV